MKRTAVIMAGGSGERFWPLSRKTKPKQLLPLVTEKTMLLESIERISPIIPPEDIFIITGAILLEPIRKALPNVPAQNIIAEPLKRNTAPCLALAAGFIAAKYSEINEDNISISVLTADQRIYPEANFIKTINSILNHIENNPELATIGITPIRPETGYGYIEVDSPYPQNISEVSIKPVIAFKEKPNYEQAIDYISKGNYLWNSGMFFWRLDTFINSMIKSMPIVGNQIGEIKKLYFNNTNTCFDNFFDPILPIFEKLPNESIDYGLMEKADNVVVARSLFDWDDIGAWDALERVHNTDANGNIIIGNCSIIDSNNSVVFNSINDKKVIVSGLGLDNLVIVATEDAIMICPKNRAQEVKKCVEEIRKNNGEKWL